MNGSMTLYEFISNPLVIVLALIEFIMKGITLWKCAINRQKGWYLAILIINSAGILPLIYLVGFQNKKI